VDEQGNPLGKVDEVVSAPAQDLLSINGMLIPMVKQFILDIDLEARTIKIRLIEGMDGGT
ncbi:MAG: hypothetical protein JNM04_01980, partial [Chthonomonas sp.]|nr:hypothetical protein [Chthonomonas sp.]